MSGAGSVCRCKIVLETTHRKKQPEILIDSYLACLGLCTVGSSRGLLHRLAPKERAGLRAHEVICL